MKKILFLLILVIFSLFVISSLQEEKVDPRVVNIYALDSDLYKIRRELELFSFRSDYSFFKETKGNFKINIKIEQFKNEDKDDVGFAIIDDHECNISLNPSETWTRTKLKLILIHELGHCLGFDHNEGVAVMDADYEDEPTQTKSLTEFFRRVRKRKEKMISFKSKFDKLNYIMNKLIDLISPSQKDAIKKPLAPDQPIPRSLIWKK